jgi:protein-disulfide isomerase
MSTLKVPIGASDHIEGDAKAACTLVEYGDYQCPHCGRAYPIVKRIQKHFGDRLRFVFRNFPLNEIHPEAESAAETSEFAAAHGKFSLMHEALFENQANLGLGLYQELAEDLGLDSAALRESLKLGKFREKVRADFNGGVRSGVNGTPTFFINGQRHDDSFDFDTLVEAIDAATASQ